MTNITDVLNELKGTRSKQSIETQFALVGDAIEAVVAGHQKLQLICGGAGIGKTFAVEAKLKSLGVPIVPVSVNNEHSFVELLWRYGDAPAIFLDDSDQLANRPACANIAKTAFGQGHVTWESRKAQAEGDPPRHFKVRCGLIWCSNLDYTNEAVLHEKMHAHWRALLSRGLSPIWIDTSNPTEVFRYVVRLATNGRMLHKLCMSKVASEKAVALFIECRDYWNEITPRQMMHIASACRLFEKDDMKLAMHLKKFLSAKRERELDGIPYPTIVGAGVWRDVPTLLEDVEELERQPTKLLEYKPV
jgi:hypothetical protein